MEFKYISSDVNIRSTIKNNYIIVISRKKISLVDSYFDNNVMIDEKRKDIERIIFIYNPKIRQHIKNYYIYYKAASYKHYVPEMGTLYTHLFNPFIQVCRNKYEPNHALNPFKDLDVLFD